MQKKELVLCADHGGIELKEYFKNELTKDYFEIIDLSGIGEPDDDYPLIISKGAKVISEGKYKYGVFFCGAGVGASITANRFKGVRAALVNEETTARLSKEHNNANVLVFSGRLIDFDEALEIFKIWWKTEFTGEERHCRRVDQLDKLEEK